LDDTVESELATIIRQVLNKGRATTRMQTLAVTCERHSPNLTKGSLHAFFGRHLDALQICRSPPQQDTRLIAFKGIP
jgi:hypothetical protein